MIITVTLNPGLDYVLQIDEIALKETQRAQNSRLYAAGKGINVSRMLARFGLQTSAWGFVGGINGDRFKNILESEGITSNFIPCKGETRMNVIITELKSYNQLRIGAKGPQISHEELATLCQRIKNLPEEVEFVHFGGSLPQGIPDNIYCELIKIVQEQNVRCILDTSNDALIEGIKANPFLIKPNLHELEQITGKKLENLDDIKKEACDIVKSGVKNVVVSFAKEGALLVNEKTIVQALTPKVDVKSKIGAGDSMVAGLIYGFYKNMSEEEVLKHGIAFGTAAVITTGTELAYKDDIINLLKEIKPEKNISSADN